MKFLPYGKNDDTPFGRNDETCSAHARSAHHEAKPFIMPGGHIMFRTGGTHHLPTVLKNSRHADVLFDLPRSFFGKRFIPVKTGRAFSGETL